MQVLGLKCATTEAAPCGSRSRLASASNSDNSFGRLRLEGALSEQTLGTYVPCSIGDPD